MSVVLRNHQRTQKIDLRLLKQIANTLLTESGIQNAKLEINFVSAGEMTRINKEFLRHASSTDVIAFDYTDAVGRASRLSHSKKKEYGDRLDSCPTVHGEIFICVDEAVVQARAYRTTWQLEIVRYLIHGVLHLLGHDDSQVGKRRKMKREENRLLRQLSRRFSLAQPARAAKLSRCKNR